MIAVEGCVVMVGAVVPIACVTVTLADWVAAVYVPAAEASGV